MPNQLALGAAGGSVSAFLVNLIHHFVLNDPGIPVPDIHCECPSFDFNFDWGDKAPIGWFLAGLSLGALIGPLVDLIWVAKERWRRFILGRLVLNPAAGPQRPLHKVLYE